MSHASLRRSNQQVERHLHLARELAVRYYRRTGYDLMICVRLVCLV